jgi:short-chain fatty acids transporter
MIGRISRFLTGFVSRYLPDPLIFAMLLTMLTFGIALALTPHTPVEMVHMWGMVSGICWDSACRWR